MASNLMLTQMKLMRVVTRFARSRVTGPLLRRAGVQLDDPEALGQSVDQSFALRDSFDRIFAERGWVAHDWINHDAAMKALELGKRCAFDEADLVLVSAYPADSIRTYLAWMGRLAAFKARYQLAMLAVADYDAGRFHACIPVVLAMIDGLGKDLTGAGFLRQGVRFARDESFLEMGPGLTALLRAMTESRSTTSTTPITMPHRHGIMHGVDLGYANEIVAAKAWAALIALGSHALRPNPTPPPPFPGFLVGLRQLAASAAKARALETAVAMWVPRVNAEVLPGAPQPGTPELVVQELLAAWVARRYNVVTRCFSGSRKRDANALAGQFRKNVRVTPKSFLLTEVTDHNFAVSTVRARLVWADGMTSEVELRVWHEDDEGFAPYGTAGADWRVISLWPLEAASLEQVAKDALRT